MTLLDDQSNDTLYAFVPFTSKGYDDAGVYRVRGLATDASLDLDGQRCDPEWLKSAMPEWGEWGNIREMHGPSAVGTKTSMEQIGNGWWVDLDVIDPLAATKCDKGVYKGLSIGIKNYGLDKSAGALALAPNGIINKGEIIEISLVDRPANPNAKLELTKMVEGTLTKVDAPTVLEVVSTGVPCDTCGGFGKVKNEGGVTAGFHTCPDCKGTGTGGINIRPSNAGGDQDNGEVGDDLKAALELDSEKFLEALIEKSELADQIKALLTKKSKGDPDCTTCDGTGKIKDGHVDCPDCVQGKALDLTDYFGFTAEEVDDNLKSVLAEVVKKDYSDAERAEMARNGQAMANGGFPIKTVADLKNAIQAIGRAKNPAAAKAHIKSRAKALGRSDLIPDSWKSPVAELAKQLSAISVLKKAADGDTYVHDPADIAAARDLIISFITAELTELSHGEAELWDISDLLSVLSGLMSWWSNEAWGGETSSPYGQGDNMDLTTLGVTPDLIKAASAENATDEDKNALAQATVKALGLDDMITSEKSAREELGKQVADLTARLVKAESMAAPRGIALRATQRQKVQAAQRETLLSEAKSARDSAALFSNPSDRAGFIAKAVELETQADLIEIEEE